MVERIRADASLTPRAMREVSETDWSDTGSGGTVSRTEQHARQLFALFVAPLRESKDAQAEFRAREWTIGALTAAFPREKRADVRPKMRALVERVTADAKPEAKKNARKSAKKGRARCTDDKQCKRAK